LVVEWDTICLSTCKIVSSWMPLVMIHVCVPDFDPTAAVCLRLWLTSIDLWLVLLASNGMRACSSCRRWSLNYALLWHHLIINCCSIICTAMLLHVASVHASAWWSSIEVSCAPSSSAALRITLLKGIWICVHSVFLSFNSDLVKVVAVLLSSFDRRSKFPVAIVLSWGKFIVDAIRLPRFCLTCGSLRSVSLCHVVVWSTHAFVVAWVWGWWWVVVLAVTHSICSLYRKAIGWCFRDRGTEVDWITSFPSCSWFICVAPKPNVSVVRISAVVMVSSGSFCFTYYRRMLVWALHFPSLANLSRDCSRLASSISGRMSSF
jgi:hypothetical protein